jgi:hypothetical protein
MRSIPAGMQLFVFAAHLHPSIFLLQDAGIIWMIATVSADAM